MRRARTPEEIRAVCEATGRAEYNSGYAKGRDAKRDGIHTLAPLAHLVGMSEAYRVGYLNGQLDTKTLEP